MVVKADQVISVVTAVVPVYLQTQVLVSAPVAAETAGVVTMIAQAEAAAVEAATAAAGAEALVMKVPQLQAVEAGVFPLCLLKVLVSLHPAGLEILVVLRVV